MFIDEVVLSFAAATPDKTAVVFRNNSLSYAALAERVNDVASRLVDSGVQRGDFVAVLLDPSLEITPALLGIARVGAIYAPLDPQHPTAQLLERAEEIRPALVIAHPHYEDLAAQLGPKVLVLSPADRPNATPLAPRPRDLSDPACIFFTSGSTGRAKGVLGSAKALCESIRSPARFLEFASSDVLDSIARYAWSISMLELLAPLVVGGTSLILDRAQALNLDWLRQQAQRCTAFHCPPALLKTLVEHIHDADPTAVLPDVRLVWYGGDVLPTQTIQLLQRVFPNAKVGTAYGCTEIFGLSHCHIYPRGAGIDAIYIGKPVDSITQLLLNESRTPSADGEQGEIYLGGERVALEYWQRQELTRERFVEVSGARYYQTGDFARQRGGGPLEFVQRRDSQVKIRGIRIELGEIDFHINALPEVKQSISLVRDDNQGNKELLAFVVLKGSAQLSTTQLRSALSAHLPDYSIPAHFYILGELPFTENFKIDRTALLEHAQRVDRQDLGLESGFERRLAEIWLEAANVKPRDDSANFFEIGGDSLSAARLAALLAQNLGISVEVADVYLAPTLRAQAERFASAVAAPESTRTPAPESVGALSSSQGQRGLVFRELFEKKKASLTCTRYVLRRDGFDDAKVKAALVALIERYPTLRTRIRFGAGNLLLEVTSNVQAEALVVRRNPGKWYLGAEGEPVLHKQSEKFNLGQDLLIRATISGLHTGGEVLQLTAHHTAADDNSMGRLATDFIELYDALVHHRAATLLAIAEPYAAFAREQAAKIASGGYKASADALAKRLLEALPMCQQRPLLKLDAWRDSSAVSSNTNVPKLSDTRKFTDYVAALTLALHQHFGRTEFVFCAHVALRRDTTDAPRVGMYVNLVPVFLSVTPGQTPEMHARRTLREFEEAMSRSDVPYEVVLASAEPLRRLGRFPFDAFVNELRFENAYPAGYEDVIVPRSFSTDSNEISLTVVRHNELDSLQFEAPATEGTTRLIDDLAQQMLGTLKGLAGKH